MARPRNLIVLALLFLLATAPAEAGRTVVHHGRRGTTVVHRAHGRVVVHRGWPLRRTLPYVYVHPVRAALLVSEPHVYLAPVVYRPVVFAVPAGDVLAWQDTDTFEKNDDWSENTFSVNERGRSLVFKVDGKLQVSFAEIVFENGDSQVVDMNDKTVSDGSWELLNFKDGRKVSHVRMVARAKSDRAVVSMFLVK